MRISFKNEAHREVTGQPLGGNFEFVGCVTVSLRQSDGRSIQRYCQRRTRKPRAIQRLMMVWRRGGQLALAAREPMTDLELKLLEQSDINCLSNSNMIEWRGCWLG